MNDKKSETSALPSEETRLPEKTILPRESALEPTSELTTIPVDIRHLDSRESPTLDATAAAGGLPDEAASRYFGDYELVGEIARGGMGVVYKARQVKLNRLVALKMILAGQLAGNDDVKRFYTEAEAAAQLAHPGITPIYEIGQHQGQHFFSMAYIPGDNLAQKLVEGPFKPVEAAKLLVRIAEAIDYAHQKNVIHRDLKPGNILLDEQGDPKVTDFGLAKRLNTESNLTGTGQVLGTPSYMSPEQAAGKNDEIGPCSDIYSLGAVLYCLLTGRPPFHAATALDTLLQVLEHEPIPPRRLNPTIPLDLESVCLKCLSKNPSERYRSARDMADDLKRFVSGEPVSAEASSTLKRAWSAMLKETRHVEVMSNWGRVWLCHAAQMFVLFLLTNVLVWMKVRSAIPYVVLWAFGLLSLLPSMWVFRFRSGIPLTPIERQLGQVWGMFAAAVMMTGVLNHFMGFEPLKLLPVAAIECGMAFGCTAAILGGTFYPMAVLCVVLAIVLAVAPQIGPLAFGTAFGVGLFIPGWKFSRAACQNAGEGG